MVQNKSSRNDTAWITGMRVVRKLRRSETSVNIKKSGLVTSSQNAVHRHLEKTVRRHLEKPWVQPFHSPTVDAYHELVSSGVFATERAFILDSGCGTGKSTQNLAAMFPQHIVIGVDQSRARLAKSDMNSVVKGSGNCTLLRAELSTFWRLMLDDGHFPERHFLFYPNPWPKPGHLSRRWHGHPVFPHLLCLGGEIELRCNWGIYAQEFAQAVSFASGVVVNVKNIQPKRGVSPFEQKYLDRGQALFSVTVPAQITGRANKIVLSQCKAGLITTLSQT